MDHLREDATKGWEIILPNQPPEGTLSADPTWPEYPGAESHPARQGFASSRGGKRIQKIAIHGTWGSYAGALSWFQSANNPYYTSAHYTIALDGRIGQSVWEHLAAHHIGIHNGTTLGIEHEDQQKMHTGPWTTDKMLRTSAKLVAHLCKKYGIPIDRQHIMGHSEFTGQDHTDPGKFWPWDKYMALVKEYAGTKPVVVVKGQRRVGEIEGKAIHEKDKVLTYAKSVRATQYALDLVESIYKYAPQRNIGADFLSVQMLLETGYGAYTGDSKPYNPAGIKLKYAIGDTPNDFEKPKTADEGARMLVNHWCAVLGKEPIGTPHGRYAVAKAVYAKREKITKIMQLGNGNWATDPGYGQKITNILDAISKQSTKTVPVIVTKPTGWDKQKTLVPPGFKPLPPRPGDYTDIHPTRFTWRADVEDLIKRIYARWPNVFINTYVQHPGDSGGKWARDTIALDVWGAAGRGAWLPLDVGNAIADFIWNDPNPPYIDWYIWQKRMWTRASGIWVPYGTNEFTWHRDHLHYTFTGPYLLLK